jgi:hypothetical protein
MAGRRVFLYVSEELVHEVAAELGSTRDAFLDTVKAGPDWAGRGGFCQQALDALEDWRQRDVEYPPYLAYLAVFVLAAGLEGDFEPWAYHPRLRTLLDMPGKNELPSFSKMFELWQDLEVWSTRDRAGELGIFEITFAGEWVHVGLPKAQALLTEAERRTLPAIFADAGLDPAVSPPTSQLARVLRQHGEGRLTARTMNRVRRPQEDRALYEFLLDAVADELAGWDGTVENGSDGGAAAVRGVLRLALELDTFGGRTAFSARCRTRRTFPDGGLRLERDGASLECDEQVPGWSTPLTDAAGGRFDGAKLDWSCGEVLADARLGWTFRLPASDVRVFVSARSQGLPYLIETDHLPEAAEFYLAFAERQSAKLAGWVDEACHGFRELKILSGLPHGWTLARCERATSSFPGDSFPALQLPDRLRVGLSGGLRSSTHRNEFFAFAPPTVVVEAGEGLVPTCADRPLHRLGAETFELPADLPRDERIQIEVGDGKRVRRIALYLASDFAWRAPTPRALADEWGNPAPAGRGVLAGAVAESEDVAQPWQRYPLLAAAGSLHRWRRFFLVGARPGELAKWPQEELPATWQPVWLVPMEREGHAIYVGGPISEAQPGRPVEDRRHIKLWKELIWYRRNRITPPPERPFAKLWKTYQEAARRA